MKITRILKIMRIMEIMRIMMNVERKKAIKMERNTMTGAK
jgi:hypothetical protein